MGEPRQRRGSLAGGRRDLVGDCIVVGVMASLLGITSAASEARANGVPARDGSSTQHSIAAVRASHRTRREAALRGRLAVAKVPRA